MSRRTPRLVVAGLLSATLAAISPARAEVKVDSDTFGNLEARSIGPAVMSGRISAVEAVPGERLTIYVGAAGGGVWKSADGGIRFKPIFDKYNQSIGALSVDPSNPKVVWVGTGESWTRNSVSVGDGVYRSLDGGDSWEKLGLADTEHIARIAVDPKNGQTVFVCATGHLFDANPERGVFRTRDGGKTWEKVLFVNNDTGCGDLALDPQDPDIVYAGLWQVRRSAYFFNSGGPGSGLYKSTDGGTTWRRLQKGLPSGDLGRIAIAAAPSRPSVVYATVESKADPAKPGTADTALYRSSDVGESWARVSSSRAVIGRPFYFSRLVVDPKNYNRVYKPGFSFTMSDDGGATFGGGGGDFGDTSYHGDVHVAWVNPQNPEELIIGTDGGVYISEDRGTHWRFAGALPVGQFYHVSYDMERPYNLYGGLQDNSSWYGPSSHPGGIGAKHWNALSPCDGFWTFADPTDNDYVYDECQGGNLHRIRKSTGESRDIKPSPKAGEPKYRFNWNSPIHLSPNEKGVLYYGAQFLLRSRDRGESWERISPDLTTNDPAKQRQDESGGLTLDNSTAENHCTIYAIAESPKNKDLIWVGTDDGNVQLTRDGGKTWTNVVSHVPGLPKNTWVSSVEPSHFDEATAYASFDGHMTGDMKSYVYRTKDYGQTWQALATPDLKGYAHVVKEDLVNPGLLYLGTEFGLFVSLDGGQQWAQFTGGLPNVAVRDLSIHPREGDLLIATHGRSLYILDDLTPLRQLTPQVLASEVAFLGARPAAMVAPAFDFSFNGDTEYEGRSPGEAATVTYYLKKRHVIGDLKLEIYDGQGKLISTVPGGKRRGINRVEWPMRRRAPRFPAAAGPIPNLFAFLGPGVPEGTYTVKLIKGKDTYASQLTLVPDPRSKQTPQDRAAQREATTKLFDLLEHLTFVVDSIADGRDQARDRAQKLPAGDALRKRLDAFAESLEKQRTALVSSKQGEAISGEEKLREEIGLLYGNVNGYEGRPTQSQLDRTAVLSKDLDAAYAKFEASFAKEASTLNLQLGPRKLEALTKLTREGWEKRGGGK